MKAPTLLPPEVRATPSGKDPAAVEILPPTNDRREALREAGRQLIAHADGLPAVPASDRDDFDWLHSGAVVLREQPATAIYFNPEGSLVIPQERGWDQEDNSFIWITRANAQTFLDRLCDVLGVGGAP